MRRKTGHCLPQHFEQLGAVLLAIDAEAAQRSIVFKDGQQGEFQLVLRRLFQASLLQEVENAILSDPANPARERTVPAIAQKKRRPLRSHHELDEKVLVQILARVGGQTVSGADRSQDPEVPAVEGFDRRLVSQDTGKGQVEIGGVQKLPVGAVGGEMDRERPGVHLQIGPRPLPLFHETFGRFWFPSRFPRFTVHAPKNTRAVSQLSG
jgi:hypothetical protein